uniref:Uncharacterized protein n=1 Tax=Escherichia coli TaxID=562 RepID=A0A288W2K1_ECOLX|nr:hypothetical protein PMPNAOBH_00005 [Escherichia coli]
MNHEPEGRSSYNIINSVLKNKTDSYTVYAWVFPDHGGRLRTPYSAFRSGTSPQFKALPFRYPLAFILSSLILLLSASAFPFETLCRIAFRIPYSLFLSFRGIFHHGTSLLAASANHLCQSLRLPRSMACSRYPLPALSAPSTGSSASSVHAATSAFPAGIRSSTYRCTATGSGFLLPGVGFQQGGADVHSDGFINYLAQLLRHMEAVKGDFSTALGKWIRAALI